MKSNTDLADAWQVRLRRYRIERGIGV